MPEPRVEQVFKTSGVPQFTFVEPNEYRSLKVALRSPGRGLVVEGPSGIGKSTGVLRALQDLDIETSVQPLSARRPADVEYIEALPTMRGFGVVIIEDFHVL
jgi:putative ribosome biogenesis GTPase RsgA